MSRSTMIIFLVGILLLIYGYLCRYLNIYFFWDSQSFGWLTISVGVLSLLIDLRKSRINQNKSIFWVRVGVSIVILFFASNICVVILFKSSPAYQSAVELIKASGTLEAETGTVQGISMIPSGSEIASFIKGEQTGMTSFVVTVRGSKAHRDVQIDLIKNPQTIWAFSGMNIVYF
jgi:hypothetical protein